MHDKTLTIGSLFSGIGGLDLGLERAGMRVIWQCEIDKYARRVLAKHWPGIPCYPDVKDLGISVIPERVDVLCGGFPCQDISTAGRRAGIHGERSGLFFEIVRLARTLRPKYIILENVAALTIRGLDTVLGELALCGYDAEWDCISAASVGARHRRDRIFIVAYPNGCGLLHGQTQEFTTKARLNALGQSVPEGDVADPDSLRWNSANIEGRLEERCSLGGFIRPDCDSSFQGDEPQRARIFRRPPKKSDVWEIEPDVGRVANGIPSRVDRLRCLGNAVVPQVGEYVGRCVVGYDATN